MEHSEIRLNERPLTNNEVRLFEAVPGNNLLVNNNPPYFTMLAATDSYIELTGKNKQELIGFGVFEIFPSNPNDPLDTGENDLRFSFQEVIRTKVIHRLPTQRYDVTDADGSFNERYWDTLNKPVFDDSGNVKAIIHSIEEITYRVKALQKENYFNTIEKEHSVFMQAPLAIHLLKGPEYIIELANSPSLELWNKGNEVIGKPLIEILPELKQQGFIALLDKVMHTGESHEAYEVPVFLIRDGKQQVYYFNFVYKPYYEEDRNTVAGVLIFASEVTDKVTAKKTLKKTEDENQKLASITEASHEFISLAAPDSSALYLNPAALRMLGWDAWEGRKMNDCIFPPDKNYGLQLINELFKKGSFSEEIRFWNETTGEPFWIQWNAFLIKDILTGATNGLATVSPNITERKRNEQALRESHERFEASINAIQGILWTNNAKGEMEGEQPGWAELTGQSYDEYQGFGWADAVHPEDAQPTVDAWLEAIEKKITFVFEHRVKTKTGVFRNFNIRAIPLLEDDGTIREWVGVHTDITEQKLSEEIIKQSEADLQIKVALRTAELQNQKNLLDNILNNSSNGISVTEMVRDENGKVIDAITLLANEAAVRFTGLPKDIYLSKRATEIDPGVLESPYGLMCLQILQTGKAGVTQYYLEPTKRWLELTISKMDDDHLIHIFTDVTPIKEGQLQQERLVEELKRSNVNLEEFAYAASHDLKEPVRKILFFSNRIRDSFGDRLDKDEKYFFERMETATRRMGSLIDDLLSYSQVSMRPRSFEKINLNELIDLVLNDLDLEIDQKEAQITVEKLGFVFGHHRQLLQAFQNLISNALKYHNPGTAPIIKIYSNIIKGTDIPLSVSTSDKGRMFQIVTVADNGIGFEQEDAERIFNVFTRLHSNGDFRGTGVGLSIVRKVIENHNGYVSAHSEVGKGATFKLYLPYVD